MNIGLAMGCRAKYQRVLDADLSMSGKEALNGVLKSKASLIQAVRSTFSNIERGFPIQVSYLVRFMPVVSKQTLPVL